MYLLATKRHSCSVCINGKTNSVNEICTPWPFLAPCHAKYNYGQTSILNEHWSWRVQKLCSPIDMSVKCICRKRKQDRCNLFNKTAFLYKCTSDYSNYTFAIEFPTIHSGVFKPNPNTAGYYKWKVSVVYT